MQNALTSLGEAFDEISGKVIVMKCAVNTAICQKLMTLFNIKPEDSLKYPFIGIVDLELNEKGENMIKY